VRSLRRRIMTNSEDTEEEDNSEYIEENEYQ
jgi:hypothetical protein